MGVIKLISSGFRYKPWRALHWQLLLSDLFHRKGSGDADLPGHLDEAINWLCRAQDARDGLPDQGGVSAGWSFEDGWLPSYPETTGYIIETFFAAARVLGRADLIPRAVRMLEWELTLQAPDGAFPGHFGEAGSHPVIFNQGQILHGLLSGEQETGRDDFLTAAVRAGEWLINQQDHDGCFRRYEHNDVPHVYNTRAIWPLAKLGRRVGRSDFIDAAKRNLDWALTQQTDSGWYLSNAFVPSKDPFTHTIAYAIRGFLESATILQDVRYLRSAEMAAQRLAKCQRDDGWLAGTYADEWIPSARYACLTGIAQMALCWLRLEQITGNAEYRRSADKAIGYVQRHQNLTHPVPQIKGAIAGSFPLWGHYSRFEYPNWAAKFFVDAILMRTSDEIIPPIFSSANDLEIR